MLNAEQFVYTTASIKSKKGYQIVAKSDRITTQIISQLEDYFYPVGIDPTEFHESRSLLLLDDDLIAYSRIKNIGVGYDGRDNTLYNHTFVFSKSDFAAYEYDARIFDKFYLEDKSIQGVLPMLSIDPPIHPFPSNLDDMGYFLRELLFSFFTTDKIALFFDAVDLPQKILMFLPKSMRLVPFSTLVVEPTKQPKYSFIMMPKSSKPKLNKDFKIIFSDTPPSIITTQGFGKIISYYADLIINHQYEDLKEIHDSFEKIHDASNKNKLILLCNYHQFQNSKNDDERSLYAENIFKILKNFDRETSSYYFNKIKSSLKQYEILEKKLKPELNPSISLLDAFFLLPSKMMLDLFNTFMNAQKSDDEKKSTEY